MHHVSGHDNIFCLLLFSTRNMGCATTNTVPLPDRAAQHHGWAASLCFSSRLAGSSERTLLGLRSSVIWALGQPLRLKLEPSWTWSQHGTGEMRFPSKPLESVHSWKAVPETIGIYAHQAFHCQMDNFTLKTLWLPKRRSLKVFWTWHAFVFESLTTL